MKTKIKTEFLAGRQSGFTLVELMVALAIGLLVVAALLLVLVNTSINRGEIEKTSRQNENGQYAIALLGDAMKNAGYLAALDPTPLTLPVSMPDPCSTVLGTLTSALSLPVQGYDNGASLSCISDVKANTDVVVVRRASTCAVGTAGCDPAVAGAPYFQASSCAGASELGSGNPATYFGLDTVTANLNRTVKDCTTLAPIYQYRTQIFFVANNDKTGDGIPTLKIADLGVDSSGVMSFNIVPLVEGIENIQIEYGIDTIASPTGSPNVFKANPESNPTCTGAACVSLWKNIVAAKIYVLARNTTLTGGFTDSKSYQLGLKADGSPNTITAANDSYKRHVYETVVRLNNTAGRNAP